MSTMQGGNQEPKILEVKQLGYIENGTGKHQSNTIYSENGLSPSLTTIEGGGTQQIKVCESQKDNTLLVKQATKQGYAECVVGGGSRFEFP